MTAAQLPSRLDAWITVVIIRRLHGFQWGLAARAGLANLSNQSIKKLTRGWDLGVWILSTSRPVLLSGGLDVILRASATDGSMSLWGTVGTADFGWYVVWGLNPERLVRLVWRSLRAAWKWRLQASVTGRWKCGPCPVPPLCSKTEEYHGKRQDRIFTVICRIAKIQVHTDRLDLQGRTA
jgi:hypothetical protein